MSDEPPLKDEEIEDLVGHLWENIDALPMHIQDLLHESRQPGKTGAVSYALLAGWALGKFDYEVGDPWFFVDNFWSLGNTYRVFYP